MRNRSGRRGDGGRAPNLCGPTCQAEEQTEEWHKLAADLVDLVVTEAVVACTQLGFPEAASTATVASAVAAVAVAVAVIVASVVAVAEVDAATEPSAAFAFA